MPQQKVIIKEDLMKVRLAYAKYYNILNSDIVESHEWQDWVNACKKAFPVSQKKSYKRFELLKNMSRELRTEPFETWCKVYEALGYKVVDHVLYARQKYEDTKFKIYQKLCCGCPNEKRCHEECEHCDEYYEELEKKGIEDY